MPSVATLMGAATWVTSCVFLFSATRRIEIGAAPWTWSAALRSALLGPYRPCWLEVRGSRVSCFSGQRLIEQAQYSSSDWAGVSH